MIRLGEVFLCHAEAPKNKKKRNADKGSHGFTPESWESASLYSRGLYAISVAPLRVIRDFILAFPALFCSSRSSVILLLLSYKMIAILYRTMGCKPRADLCPSPCLFRREDPPSGRRNTQCFTTAAVSVGAFSRFLLRWAGRGF